MTLPGLTRADDFKGLLWSLAGAALLAAGFTLAKYAMPGFERGAFALTWQLAALAGASAAALFSGSVRELRPPRHTLRWLLLLGVLSGVGLLLAWAGLRELDPAFNSFLWRFSPVLTMALGVLLLREVLSAEEAVAVGVMVLGGVLSTVEKGWHVVGRGVIFVLIACAFAAAQSLIAKTQARRVRPTVMVFYRTLVAGVVVLAWALARGELGVRAEVRHWAALIAGALLGSCLGFLCLYRSYRHWELSHTAIVVAGQPLFALPLVYVILDHQPNAVELGGGLIILLGAAWLAWVHR